MSLWQMSFSGSVIILVILGLRSLWGNRIPRKVFPVLWAAAVLRLAIPFAVPSPFSAYTLLGQNTSVVRTLENTHMLALLPMEDAQTGREAAADETKRNAAGYVEGGGRGSVAGSGWEEAGAAAGSGWEEAGAAAGNGWEEAGAVTGNAGSEAGDIAGYMEGASKGSITGNAGNGEERSSGQAYGRELHPWNIVWAAGMLLCAVYFSFVYLRCRREFAASLPVEHEKAREWLKQHRLRRPIAIRSSGCVPAPLTYGVFRPVILVPSGFDWEDTENLRFVLEHEFVHIRRLDAVTKLLLTGVLCVHWFNPLVWVMYVLFNRDLELSCDEAVVYRFGLETRAAYASTLIQMEEEKSGFVPLYNGFGKSGVEERIRAVMKSGRASAAGALAAVCLVLGATAVFATSAMEKNPRQFLTTIPGGDFTEEESRKLFSLWIEGYEEMPVSQYQDRMWKMTDEPEYGSLLFRLSETELVYEMPEGDEADALEEYFAYFNYVLMPLIAEQWETREFSDCVTTEFPAPVDNAILEYVVGLQILDREKLTVGEYARVHQDVREALRDFLQEKTAAELRDGQEMVNAVQKEFVELASRESTDSLEVSVTGIFQPLGGYGESDGLFHEQVEQQNRREWEKLLAPYVPLGLSYEFREEREGLEIAMYYQGREVKGIFDGETGIWISAHAGNTTYSPGAVELMAVYENGKLTGLRQATEEEQQIWDEQRNAASAQLDKGQTQQNAASLQWKPQEENEEQEPRMYPHGTREDYDSLLALKTDTYLSMTLENFNSLVLDWCNEDPERMEGIGEDVARNEYQVSLTQEEKAFAELTFSLSREENRRFVESLQTGAPRKDPQVNGGRLYRETEDGIGWCSLNYTFSYHIADGKTVTVGERDRCIGAMLEEIRSFWEDTDLKELTGLTEARVAEKFREMAEKCKSRQVVIQVDEEEIRFDHTGAVRYGVRTQQNVAFERVELMEYEDTGRPYFAHSLTNNTDKTITEIQYCMLAYDREGNPQKLYWNFLKSPKESSYEYLVELDGISVWPGCSLEPEGGWSLYDGPRMPGWPKVGDGGANRAFYGIYGIRQITFGDGTVWVNEGYEEWLDTYRGKQIPVGELEAYYPYKVETGQL